jgi:hypothetical protein
MSSGHPYHHHLRRSLHTRASSRPVSGHTCVSRWISVRGRLRSCASVSSRATNGRSRRHQELATILVRRILANHAFGNPLPTIDITNRCRHICESQDLSAIFPGLKVCIARPSIWWCWRDSKIIRGSLDGSPVLMLVGGKDNYTPAAPCIAYADALRSKGAHVTLKEYPDAWHGFDRPTPLHSLPLATSARECHGSYDLDRRTLTMVRDGQTLAGASAAAESKRCLVTGVTLGGDPEAQAQSPAEVAAFLKAAFE